MLSFFASFTAGVSDIFFFFFDGTTMTQAGWCLMKSKFNGLIIGFCFGVLGVDGREIRLERLSSF